MSIFTSLSAWAKRVKRDAVMLWFACRHQETPLLIKGWCLFTVAYALSPVDLIPDFIPVLGYIDEVFLLPAMIWLAVHFLPQAVTEACRSQADQWMLEQKAKPKSYAGAAVIVLIWTGILYLAWQWFA